MTHPQAQEQDKPAPRDSVILIANIVECASPQTVKMTAQASTLDELLDVFERFLVASGYSVDGHIQIVKGD